MKRSSKPRVSWPSGPKLCQVKTFRTEDCPAKVMYQARRRSYPKESNEGPDLPPGFEGNHYKVKPKVSTIPRIKWKQPTKIILSPTWLLGSGGESKERHTQNLRIFKLPQAVYPHRNAVPSRPSVSPAVEAEHYDDSKTPTIPIEEVSESAVETSQTSVQSISTANKEDHLETKLPPSSEAPLSGLPPDLTALASATLKALIKSKEQGSLVDPDLLIKILSDPEMVKKLMADRGKSSETKNQPVEANINPTRIVPQHITASPMASQPQPQPVIIPQEQRCAVSKPCTSSEQTQVSLPMASQPQPQPVIIPHGQRFAVSKPFTSSEQRPVPLPMASLPQPVIRPQEQRFAVSKPFTGYGQRRVSLPKPANGNISSLNPVYGIPVRPPVHPSFGIATKPSLPIQHPPSSLPTNPNLQRPPFPFAAPQVMVNPQPQLQPYPQFRPPEMNNVPAPVGFVRPPPQMGFGSYPMNLNHVHSTHRPRPVVQPPQSVDHFKNLIRDHGLVNHETNQYHPQSGNFKVQKQCIYFGTPRGCTLGDNCIYLHNQLSPNFETGAPMAKRMRFGGYGKNGS